MSASLLPLAVALPPLLLLSAGLIPSAVANGRPRGMRRLAVSLTLASLGLSLLAGGLLVAHGPADAVFVAAGEAVRVTLGVYFDSLAALMMVLISFIGWVIARYSARYLDGEATQGQFVRWICFTLGAALLLVVSRNLAMFFGAWILTSFGLHRLLTHYPDRPAARMAARKKFLVSRFGDLLLLSALVLTYRTFGSFEYADLFAAAGALQGSGEPLPASVSWIATLFVLGAMTKSAQFPMHSWLPDTMETPTPVSALMHAGIINAGGFLVLRLSPLVAVSSFALDFLAVIGATTALFGSVVMLTQTSVKRSLAYSTVAQMGFMMLQCGLGAFSAALLHIIAHSLYKAHAFLSAGSVLERAARLDVDAVPPARGGWPAASLAAAIAAAAGLCFGISHAIGFGPADKPGAIVLGLVLTLALSQLMWGAFQRREWSLAAWGVAGAAAVSACYFAACLVMETVLASTVPSRAAAPGALLTGLIGLGFVAAFAFQASLGRFGQSPVLRTLYVHASNGFYIDLAARQLATRVWRF